MAARRPRFDQLVSWSPVFLLGGLAALTYWLDAQVQSPASRGNGATRHDPDLYIEKFSAVSFDTSGRVLQSLAAARAHHYPDDGSIDLTAPALAFTESGKPRMAVTADAGTVSGDRETVTLRGSVRATRDAPVTSPTRDGGPTGPATLTTELLRVIPKLGIAETDRPVTIEEPRGIIHATGMVFDNNTHTFKLKSALRGTIQPNPRPK